MVEQQVATKSTRIEVNSDGFTLSTGSSSGDIAVIAIVCMTLMGLAFAWVKVKTKGRQ